MLLLQEEREFLFSETLGRMGTSFGYRGTSISYDWWMVSTTTINQTCPHKRPQKSLHRKLVPIPFIY